MSGCVVGSVGPFYTPDVVVDQPELYGTWVFDEGVEAEQNSQLVLSPGKLTLFDDQGKPSHAQITFFKVEDVVFADIFAEEGQIKTDLVGESPPVHLISLVKYEGGKLFLNPLDYEWLAKEVQAGIINISYQKLLGSDDILFTASPEQWVEFLKTYGKDPKAFPSNTEGWLIRKSDQEKSSP